MIQKTRLLSVTLCVLLSGHVFAQKNNIQNAWRSFNLKELEGAKKAIDMAAEHPDTKDAAKTWFYRGKIYLAINDDKDKYKNLDPDAAEKAFQSFLTCLKLDKDAIYQSDENNNADGLLIMSSLRLHNKAGDAFINKDYERAMRYFSALFDAFAYDKQKSLQRNNITEESITHKLYITASTANNKAKAKEYLQKLIDAKYKSADIYLDMSRIYLEEKDTASALTYIEKGRYLFEENQALINAEVSIYVAQKKLDVLLQKITESLESTPDNEILQYLQGKIYEEQGKKDNAIVSYTKAIEIKPDYFDALYSLGALHFNNGVEWNNKVNGLPLSATAKAKEYDTNAEKEFKNALTHFEKALELNDGDKTLLRALKQLYARTGQEEKMKQIDEKLNLKK